MKEDKIKTILAKNIFGGNSEHYLDDYPHNRIVSSDLSQLLSAMKEVMMEESIRFAEWISTFLIYVDNKGWVMYENPDHFFTTDQLYDEFTK